MQPDAFRAARLAASLSQASLARRWGIHPRTVSAWERGLYPVPEWASRLISLEHMEETK